MIDMSLDSVRDLGTCSMVRSTFGSGVVLSRASLSVYKLLS